ncbi:hypothetical protein [Aquimarina algiphila]|uniref:hypothetical protein n=1 Tax=Aquimarina algiphila TaxID=2047982 RepID=UPI0024922FD9|nr:hypothetical protein [Aquimarina algiphila]
MSEQTVNYISHLNAVFETFHNDERIKQGHITLYLAFFHLWNRKFFKGTLTVNRELIMERAKIKSKTTYHNHLRDLDTWGYLQYYPSYHPSRGSKIKMTRACTKSGTSTGTKEFQILANCVPKPSQKLVTSIKHKTKENLNKQPKAIFNESEVALFFKKNNWPEIEARKFYVFIKSKKWKTDNWRMIAKIFAKNDFKLKEPKKASPISGYVNCMREKRNEN